LCMRPALRVVQKQVPQASAKKRNVIIARSIHEKIIQYTAIAGLYYGFRTDCGGVTDVIEAKLDVLARVDTPPIR